MLRRPIALGLLGCAATCALRVGAQISHAEGPLPSFEVATVRPWRRPVQPPTGNGEPVIHQQVTMFSPGTGGAQKGDGVHIIIPALELIGSAYGLPPDSGRRIVGGPAWLREDADQYQIDAKIEEAEFRSMQRMTPEQQHRRVQLMEQMLLADRFGLKVHFETRELPVFALVVAKGGPKLAATKAEERSRVSTVVREQTREMTGTAVTMTAFVNSPLMKGPAGGRPVSDETGLTGAYDFVLRWSVDEAGPMAPGLDGPAFSTALQEQLGLKLVPSKAEVEVIVVDHMERPSEN